MKAQSYGDKGATLRGPRLGSWCGSGSAALRLGVGGRPRCRACQPGAMRGVWIRSQNFQEARRSSGQRFRPGGSRTKQGRRPTGRQAGWAEGTSRALLARCLYLPLSFRVSPHRDHAPRSGHSQSQGGVSQTRGGSGVLKARPSAQVPPRGRTKGPCGSARAAASVGERFQCGPPLLQINRACGALSASHAASEHDVLC